MSRNLSFHRQEEEKKAQLLKQKQAAKVQQTLNSIAELTYLSEKCQLILLVWSPKQTRSFPFECFWRCDMYIVIYIYIHICMGVLLKDVTLSAFLFASWLNQSKICVFQDAAKAEKNRTRTQKRQAKRNDREEQWQSLAKEDNCEPERRFPKIGKHPKMDGL